ncbi:MAG: cation-translocating P-type ATPase [Arcobacteraceae bacterium]
MNTITIKSDVANRARLKSNIFGKLSNIELIKNNLQDIIIDFRQNVSCKSIIISYSPTTTLNEVIAKIDSLFISTSKNLDQTLCSIGSSCATCLVEPRKSNISFTRKIVEFGLLTGYSLYLFTTQNLLGLSIVSAPLSLISLVSLVAAVPLLKDSYQDIKEGKFTLQTFLSGTLLTAIAFGESMAAFEIIYILRAGMLLEEYVATKSKKQIQDLIEIDTKNTYILVDDVELQIPLQDVKVDDIVVCRAGDKIPVDGIIINGSAQIDESLINGRSENINKEKQSQVYAGTLCETGRIYIKVSAVGDDRYISRVMSDVEKSLCLKSPSQLEADLLAKRLLKIGTLLTLGTLVVTGSFINAFSVMIIMACPCSTILAASTAISAGIANGAKLGILIKGGESLEKVSQSEVFCFDKTGTLTTGKPIIKDIITAKGVSKNTLIEYLATAEYRNTHPIALSILKKAKELDLHINQAAQTQIIAGFGVKSIDGEHTIIAGNKKFFDQEHIDISRFEDQVHNHLNDAKTIVYVSVDDQLLGFITLEHEVRSGTKKMISDLRRKGVKHIALITGDEEKVAQSFANNLGFDTVFANQSPYDKAKAIEELKTKYKNVVMVGDGVNDTLAMSKADVSISFASGGSQMAIEVSDIAVTHSHPEDVVNLYNLSKKSLKVVNQNYWIGTSTNLIGAAFASIGLLSPAAAGAIHIGHTTSIMANSSRLAIDNNS